MNVYKFSDYRELIKKLLQTQTQTELANNARISKSYFSKILHNQSDLDPDQWYRILANYNLNEEEIDYCQLLLDKARTGMIERRNRLQNKINSIQKLKNKTEVHLQPVNLEDKKRELYYREPIHQLVHISLSIPRFQEDSRSLAEQLGISKDRLKIILRNLEEMQLVSRSGNKTEWTSQDLHLSSSSPVYKIWRQAIKIMLMNRLENQGQKEDYSFSVVFNGSQAMHEIIQEEFFLWLESIKLKVAKSENEHTYQMSFDLLRWL